MECSQCGFENPQGAKFCNRCGVKLEITCSSCGKVNPAGSSFCNECGQNLRQPSEPLPKDLSFDEKLAKIQKYLPTGLTEKILAQRDKIEGERKHVTVMFCDMVGFTPLVEKLGPEDAYALMDQVQEILIHKVHEYEGTVNQLTGDGLMALFGAPIALEDAPQRGIRSSLAIHREMTRFSDKIREESGFPPIKMRIGINTGPVVVGTVGNDLRVEFAAVGDTVNTASRMEGLAEPGTTCVTEETFKLTEGFFRFEGLGFRDIKGKDEPMKVYRAIAPSSRRTRFEVTAERGLTSLVARDREVQLLLEGFEEVKGGRGRAFSIAAEAGVGKSRLLYEFRKAVSNEYVTFLEGKCLSYARGTAYQPVIDILKGNFYLQEGDEDREIRDKVKKGLDALGMDEVSTMPFFLELLSVKDSGIDKLPISPEARKDRIIQCIKTIVLKGAEIRPLVLAFEDLHWIDESSEEVLKHVLDAIPAARVLLIFTYRLEFLPSWGAKSYHMQVNLNRFSPLESHTMVSSLLATEKFAPDLEDPAADRGDPPVH
jgi:class 3 adenylate cyclase